MRCVARMWRGRGHSGVLWVGALTHVGVLQAKEQIGDGLSEGQTEAITRNERQIEKLQEEMLVGAIHRDICMLP